MSRFVYMAYLNTKHVNVSHLKEKYPNRMITNKSIDTHVNKFNIQLDSRANYLQNVAYVRLCEKQVELYFKTMQLYLSNISRHELLVKQLLK